MNYCNAEQAALIAVCKGISEDTIQADWLNWIDALIEQYTGQGYKGATRTVSQIGDNNSLLRLPSKAASITSITENGQALNPSDYLLEYSGRYVERQNTTYIYAFGQRTGYWTQGYRYVVTYVEPTTIPETYELAAAECVAVMAMFVQKYKEYGLGLTASDAGSAGKVSTASSTSFPASLAEELRRTIQQFIRKSGV